VPRGENDSPGIIVAAARDAVAAGFDLDRILEIARTAMPLEVQSPRPPAPPAPVATVGVVRDRAFSFYYPENLEALQQAGARLAFVDALTDAHLPPMDALYIGGGFPEVFLAELEANRSLREDILAAIEDGLPVYAECGGLMYLSRSITYQERSAQMVGALPCQVTMTDRPQGHGYVEAKVGVANPFFPVGTVLRGHEFHNSAITGSNDLPAAYQVTRGHGLDGRRDALIHRNVLAAYTHLHALATPEWGPGLVAAALRYRGRR
jgi:cobyrinic acid a,c-diamide synthase